MNLGREIRKGDHPDNPERSIFKPWDRHGLILMTVGVSYIFIGIVLLLSDQSSSGRTGVESLLDTIPYAYWCVILMIVGAIAILSSRLVSISRTLGYVVLTGWSTFWAGIHILSGLSYPMDLSIVALGMVWALMAFLWWAISGLVVPPKKKEGPI